MTYILYYLYILKHKVYDNSPTLFSPFSYSSSAWFRLKTLQSKIQLSSQARERAIDLPIFTGMFKLILRICEQKKKVQ